MPIRLLSILGGTAAVLLVLTALLGSSGETEGDPGTGQQIANVTFPLLVLLLLAIVVISIVSLVRGRRRT